jgi:hypothetical protein
MRLDAAEKRLCKNFGACDDRRVPYVLVFNIFQYLKIESQLNCFTLALTADIKNQGKFIRDEIRDDIKYRTSFKRPLSELQVKTEK